MTYKIEKNIPPPTCNGNMKYPFHEMEVSDSFFAPSSGDTERAPVLSAFAYGRRNGKKFTSRKVTENGLKGFRIWRIE